MKRIEDIPAGGPLAGFASDTYSQMGEDGIIAEVIERIGVSAEPSRWCVEVGAWDGLHLSNTARLIREEGYTGIMIEGDADRVAQQREAYRESALISINAMVATSDDQSLDSLLAETPIPYDFDLLSIDVDGCDYHIWSATKNYRPRIVVVEYNPTIPNEIIWVQPDDPDVNQGASAAAFIELANQKDYTLVATTGANLIFVRSDCAGSVIGGDAIPLAEMRDDSYFRNFVFVGYDGSLHTSQDVVLPWHGYTTVPNSRLQVLPRLLRRFYGGGSNYERGKYVGGILWVNPAAFGSRFLRKIS